MREQHAGAGHPTPRWDSRSDTVEYPVHVLSNRRWTNWGGERKTVLVLIGIATGVARWMILYSRAALRLRARLIQDQVTVVRHRVVGSGAQVPRDPRGSGW